MPLLGDTRRTLTGGFPKIIRPFTEAGIETWVAPAINNYRQVYPNFNLGLPDIQQFTRDGQRLGALRDSSIRSGTTTASRLQTITGMGSSLGRRRPGRLGSRLFPRIKRPIGPVFHGDQTGKINQAQLELQAAMDLMTQAKVIANTEGSDGLYWADPWTPDGQKFAAKMRPLNAALRLHAERAISLIHEARAAAPALSPTSSTKGSGPLLDPGTQRYPALEYSRPNDPAYAYAAESTTLREPNAIQAMEFGARRVDFLGLKFQLTDEIAAGYARAYVAATSSDPKIHRTTSRELVGHQWGEWAVCRI